MADLKSIGKKAISIFWSEGESPAQDLGPNLSPQPAPEAAAAAAPIYVPPPRSETAASDNPFYKELEKEIGKNMPPAIAEFVSQLAVINEKFANLDEATRDQLAFQMAQTAMKARSQELTVAQVIQGAAAVVDSLGMEESEFSRQNEQGFQQKVAEVRRKIDELKQGISAREKRLVEVQKELDAFIAARTEEKKKLESEKAKLLSDQLVTENEISHIEQKKRERETTFHGAMEAHRQIFDALRARLAANLQKLK
jgi:hypothetical protein